jgi:DNA repair protein RecN (Recombination protein N)
MLLTALSLLTGARADSAVVRAGAERALITGRFAIRGELLDQVKELGAQIEEGELLLTRTVTSEGKSRAMIGGASTTVSALTDVGSQILSIHGQSANFGLLKAHRAREILDSYGSLTISKPLAEFQSTLSKYREVLQNIAELERLESTRERELERLTTFLAEFDGVKPLPQESKLLRERILTLENVDSARAALASALELLSESEGSVSSQLAHIRRALESSGADGASKSENLSLIKELSILANELSSSLRRQEELLNVEPGALEQMHSRRAAVQGLIKRYGDGTLDDPESALIAYAARSREFVLQLTEGDQAIASLQEERAALGERLCELSKALTKARHESATLLAEAISHELRELAMPGAQIYLSITAITEGLSVAASQGSMLCSASGSDEVTFLLIPHPGAAALPINKGASGGELSRIMLAIEVVLAGRSSIPTYIFDEIDVGVGGKAAIEVGRRLSRLATTAQVLVVTHLPQVAAWADTHFSIQKSSSESVTSSDLALLSPSERANELARMMAGREESALAREHARELLEFVAAEQKELATRTRSR